jgi:EAL domain-containing protein (putative c-di-GMP-specific phosphodiesterase class I)/CheY-like chemotaxis protein
MASPQVSAATDKTRVLVVEDSMTLRNAFVRKLEGARFDVVSAVDGTSAAKLVAEGSYSVIVSDIAMPGMDGLQLLRKVRERDLDVPVILMSGTPTLDSAIRAVELGALRYLVKPFEPDVLLQAVTHAARLHKIAKLKREALAVVGANANQGGDLTALHAAFDGMLTTLWIAVQPIVDATRREIFAFEALMRSDEPRLPNPPSVLEAAERLGRLTELGRAVRHRAAKLVDAAPAANVFINLHPHDLLDDDLYAATSPLAKVAKRVVLEITERAPLDDVPQLASRVAALRKMGFRLAVDDLGAGYAGLTSFTQLEPDVVKFDMELVRGIDGHEKKRMLVRSMAALFAEMGLTVIAEGIESPGEGAALSQIGCALHQGYLYARPDKPYPTPRW